MICTSCRYEIPDGQKFCTNCGVKLIFSGVGCPSCKSVNSPTGKYCGNCGESLATGIMKRSDHEQGERPIQEEQKLATALVAVVQGFSSLDENLDATQAKQLMERCSADLTEQIEIFGGVIDKYTVNGMIAVFGAPISYEDHEERAIMASFGMQRALLDFNDAEKQFIPEPMSLKIGLNTGRMTVGQVNGTQNKFYTTLGDTVNLASMLSHIGKPGQILVGNKTYEGIKHAVVVGKPTPIKVKGDEETAVIRQVKEIISNRHIRIDGDQFDDIFFDRHKQIGQLKSAFQQVIEGKKSELVYICGSPLSGKTRMLTEFILKHLLLDQGREQKPKQEAVFFYGQGLSYNKKKPFYLFSEMLQRFFGIQGNESVDERQKKTTSVIAEYVWFNEFKSIKNIKFPTALPRSRIIFDRINPQQREAIRLTYYLTSIMGIPFEDNFLAPIRYDEIQDPKKAAAQRSAIIQVILDLLRYIRIGAGAPLFFILDHIEECDSETIETIRAISQKLPDLRSGMILVGRSPIEKIFPTIKSLEPKIIKPNPFGKNQLSVFTKQVLKNQDDLPTSYLDSLSKRSSNIPGFVELLVKKDLQTYTLTRNEDNSRWIFDAYRIEEAGIPVQIVKIIQTLFDKISPEEKILLQKAALIGEKFWLGLLSYLCDQSIEPILENFVEKGIVTAVKTSYIPGDREFYFTRCTERRVIYETIPKSERKKYHLEVATWLEKKISIKNAYFLKILASHYQDANRFEESYQYYQEAGEYAFRKKNIVGTSHALQRSLDLVQSYDPQDSRKLTTLYERFGDLHRYNDRYQEATKYYYQAVEHNFVIETGLQIDGDRQTAQRNANLQRKLADVYQTQGNFAKSQELIDSALRGLGDDDASEEKARVLLLLTDIFRKRGDYQKAEHYATSALNMAHEIKNNSLIWQCCDIIGDIHRVLLKPSNAVKYFNYAYKGRKEAEKMGELAQSIQYLGLSSIYQGNTEKGLRYIQKSISFYENLSMAKELAYATNLCGRIHLERGSYQQALYFFERGRQLMEETRNGLYLPIYHYYTGRTKYCIGELKESFYHLEIAAKQVEETENIKLIIKVYVETCRVSTELRYSGKALNIIEMAIDMSRKMGLEPLMTRSLLQQAESHLTLDYRQSAINSCLKALEITEKNDSYEYLKLRGVALRILSDTYMKAKDKAGESKAMTCYQESIELLEKIRSPFLLAKTYANYGFFMKKIRKDEIGDQYIKKAKDLFEKVGARHELTKFDE